MSQIINFIAKRRCTANNLKKMSKIIAAAKVGFNQYLLMLSVTNRQPLKSYPFEWRLLQMSFVKYIERCKLVIVRIDINDATK